MSRDLRESLDAVVQHNSVIESRENMWRKIRDIALLECETERIRSAFLRDPMERFEGIEKDVERICQEMKVVEYHKVQTIQGYCRVETTICFETDEQRPPYFLHCRYERKDLPTHTHCTEVTYYIDYQSSQTTAKDKLLWVQVLCAKPYPSPVPAVCMDEDDDEWSDIDEDEDDEQHVSKQVKKKLKVGSSEVNNKPAEVAEEPEVPDRFTAGINPEVLHDLMERLVLIEIDEGTAFFLLMSLDCYEHEWDLVGFVLDAVFGFGDDKEEHHKE